MRSHMHLTFDAQPPYVQSVFCRLRLGLQPVRSPANEICCEDDERLLKSDGWFGSHFEVVRGEHLLALFNPGKSRLPAVVLLEPPWQMLRNRLSTEVKQGALLEGFAGVEARKPRHLRGKGSA